MQTSEMEIKQHLTDRETFNEIIDISCECYYNWENLIYFSRLQEDWIREGECFMNNVAWSRVIKYQNVSKDFIREYKDQILPLTVMGASILQAIFGKKFLDEIVGKDFNK